MHWKTTAVIQRAQQWTVQAESSVGEAAELDCVSETQARYFAAVLSLGPSALPRAAIVRRLGSLPRPAEPAPVLRARVTAAQPPA